MNTYMDTDMEIGEYVVVGNNVLQVVAYRFGGYILQDAVSKAERFTQGMGYPLTDLPAEPLSLSLAPDFHDAQAIEGRSWPGV